MVVATPEQGPGSSAKPKAVGLFVSITSLMALCAKRASRVVLRKKKNEKEKKKLRQSQSPRVDQPRSPLARPKQLLKTISDTAVTLVHKKKHGDDDGGVEGEPREEEWGDGGVWQRTILMGDKCQPLDFSGVIYYDSNGKQMNEVPPRSPRASPLPGYLTRASEK